MTAFSLLSLRFLALMSQEPVTAIRAGSMLDLDRGVTLNNMVILVKGERIQAVGTAASVTIPEGARILDLLAATVLPGLIDAHVHLSLGNPDSAARATLLAGFTSVQDLGALGQANLRLRDAIASGAVPGPRMRSAGSWIGVAGGICDFDGRGVRGEAEYTARVREDIAHGADLIKVCVSGWPGDAYSYPDSVEIADAELVAVVREANGSGRKVVAHATSRRGIAMAVAAGVAAIVHSGFADSATVHEMKGRNVFMVPTLLSFSRNDSALAALRRHMTGLFAAGIPVAFGTDAGVIPHGRNAKEFSALVRAGMTPLATLRAATRQAAELVSLGNEIGSITPGRYADIIAVVGDPLNDIGVMERVVFVMKSGRVYRNDL